PVAAGRTISWGRALAVNIPFYYLWALLTPLLIRLARRFPLTRGRWGASLAVHVPLSLVVTALQLLAANALLFPAAFLPGPGSGRTDARRPRRVPSPHAPERAQGDGPAP